MVIYKCPICDKKYAVEDRFSESDTFAGESITCSACGSECKIVDNNCTDNAEEGDDTYLSLMREQLKTSKKIEKMIRFFYILTWFIIIIYIIAWLVGGISIW